MNPRVAQPNDPAYLKAALSMVGVSEARNNPKVLATYHACGHKEIRSTSVAWCAAFLGWSLVQGGLPTSKPISDNLLAASYVNYPGKKFTKHDTIPRGAICVWPRDEGSGHVNFCLADLGDKLLCVGGNQSNGEGGGVTIVSYPKSSLRIAVLPSVPTAKPVPPQPDVEPVPLPRPKPPVQDTEQADPDPEPAPRHSPVAWWKKPFVWLGGTIATALGGVNLSVDAQFLWGLNATILILAVLFVVWVYAFPPRGKFWKGVFDAGKS